MSVLIAASGHFADIFIIFIFDLYFFGVVRVASLKDLGISQENILDVGMKLFNLSQMTGLLVDGIFGDKRGRVSVLSARFFFIRQQIF